MTTAGALLGLVLGVLIWAGRVPPLPRTALGTGVVLVSLLLASAQSYPLDLGALDARATAASACGAVCAPPAMNGGSIMPGRHRPGPTLTGAVAGPIVPGAPLTPHQH